MRRPVLRGFGKDLHSPAILAPGVLGIVGIGYLLAPSEGTATANWLVGSLGQWHPLLVHFPIGLLIITCSLEFLGYQGEGSLRNALSRLGILGAAASALTGFFLAGGGGFDSTSLFRHKVSAIALIVTGSLYLLASGKERFRPHRRWLMLGMGVLVVLTGHLGATLTHGSGYLTRHLPERLKSLIAGDSGMQSLPAPDSVLVYRDLVQPVFEHHCDPCHGSSKTKGGLRLDSISGILAGGEDGSVMSPGNADASPLFQRIVLAPDHPDRMPPGDRAPVPIGETELIRWWIDLGAEEGRHLIDIPSAQITPPVRTVLSRLGLSRGGSGSGLNRASLPPLPETVLEELRRRDVPATYLSEARVFLQVDFSQVDTPVSASSLEPLSDLAERVSWLNLAGQTIPPDAYGLIGRLVGLRGLYLQKSSIQNSDLQELAGLARLEYLNLYGTEIGDEGLMHLTGLSRLKNLYLWQTQVTNRGAASLQKDLTALHIHGPLPEEQAPQGAPSIQTGN